MKNKIVATSLLCLLSWHVYANQSMVVKMYSTTKDGSGSYIGTVTFSQHKCGLLITPNLNQLTSGVHGFHIHEHPSCQDHGMAAAGHLDPQHTGKHMGPFNDQGHLGDLPALIVDQNGTATMPILAPRIHMDDLKGHTLMIHAGGDNYSDTPEKLGGGSARIACGLFQDSKPVAR